MKAKLTTKPDFPARATLHFLESGDFLFVDHERGGASKFLAVDAVSRSFLGLGVDSGWMPAGLVRHGLGQQGPWYVFSAPAQKVDILLVGTETKLTVPIPRTVMAHVGKQVYLWATASAHFDPRAKLAKAPFANVHADGRVCWGQNAAQDAEPMKARETWERFFDTVFNNDLANGKCNSEPRNVNSLLIALDGKTKFPASELVETGLTIAEAVSNVLKGG